MIIMMNSGGGAGFDLAVVDHLLTTTRAVRKRIDLDRPVEPEVIDTCLRLASQAPSGGNGQRWRWMVLSDPDRKKLVAEWYAESFARYIAPRQAALRPDDRRGHRMVESATYLADHMAEMPLLVIPCTLDRLAPDAGAEERASLYGGVFPAVWSFQLALRSRGIGSALTTLHLAHEREIGEALGIPETVTQVALLPVGYYTGDDFKVAPRRPAEELTYWDTWKVVR